LILGFSPEFIYQYIKIDSLFFQINFTKRGRIGKLFNCLRVRIHLLLDKLIYLYWLTDEKIKPERIFDVINEEWVLCNSAITRGGMGETIPIALS